MKKNPRYPAVIIISAMLCLSMLSGCEEDEEFFADDETIEEDQPEADAADGEASEEEYNEPEEDASGSDQPDEPEQTEENEPKETSAFCFAGKDVNGESVDMAEVFAGNRITMVNLWASWCGPCAGEIPELERMNAEFKEKGCAVVGILLDGEDPEGLEYGKHILKESNVTYLNVIAPADLEDEIGLEGYPTTYFVDSNGKILGDPVIGAYTEQYRETLDELLSGL